MRSPESSTHQVPGISRSSKQGREGEDGVLRWGGEVSGLLGGRGGEWSLARGQRGEEAVTQRKMCSGVAWPAASRGSRWHSAPRVTGTRSYLPFPSPIHPWRAAWDQTRTPCLPPAPRRPQTKWGNTSPEAGCPPLPHKMLAGAAGPCPWRREGSSPAGPPQEEVCVQRPLRLQL